MAVPKKRTGKSAQGHRRSNWKAKVPEVTKCTNCGELVLTHTVCTSCGYYKGESVSLKSTRGEESLGHEIKDESVEVESDSAEDKDSQE